jgi:hypothetical protein
VRLLLLPRVVEMTRSRVVPATRSQALLRLSPSSLLLPVSWGARGLDRLTRLVESVPCYWLELGRDLQAIPKRIDEVLEAEIGA